MGGGTSDIIRPSVQFAAVGGGTSNAVKIALATVGGLLAVELVLLIVAMASRRSSGTAPPLRRIDTKTPAGVG